MDKKLAALEQENRWLKTVLDAINEEPFALFESV